MTRFAGIDIGGTSIKYGIVVKGKVDWKKIIPTPKNEKSLNIDLKKIVQELIKKKAEGIGIGFPGYIEQSSKKFIGGPNLKFKVDVKKIMGELNYTNYRIDNDGNIGALAEYEHSYKGKVKNLIFLSFGTGIGGGIINNSKLVRGEGSAGELGHILISNDPNLEPCACGKIGCFESLASAKKWSGAVEDLMKEEPLTELSLINKTEIKGSSLFSNNLSLTTIQVVQQKEFINNISRGLISLYEIFDNQVFVIGGSFTNDSNQLIELVIERTNQINKYSGRNFPEIYFAKLKSDAGLIGATLLLND